VTNNGVRLRELVARAELVDVVIYEVSGKRRDGFELVDVPVSPDSTQMKVIHDGDEERIRIRCQLRLSARDGIYAVDGAAIFKLSEPTKLHDELVDDFTLHIGIPTVYPYLRVELQMAARRLGLKPPILSLFKPEEHETELKRTSVP
jgi:hypothetical protein